MVDKDPAKKILKQREKYLKKINRSQESEITRMAIVLFLKVFAGLGFLIFSVLLMGLTLLYVTSTSILHPEYKIYWPWTLVGSLLLGIFGWMVFSSTLRQSEGEKKLNSKGIIKQ